MGGRVTSPVLVGRRAELEALRAALTEIAPGAGPIVTIAGDAGVGKSRLLAELVASIRSDPPGPRPVTVASAACIEVAAGELPYVPLLELLTNLGTDLAGPAATEASDLAGELAGADAGAIAGAVGTSLASAGAGRTRHLVRLHALLAGVADERDLVLILDDLQWADRSTLDAIAFLASRFAGGSVTIVLAYRSDDLHRRHPIRPWLGEIRRRSTRLDLELQPLAPDAVAEQIAGILGGPAGRDLVRAVVDRADGNPFAVEELVALGRPAGLPDSLRDVLLARLDPLDAETLALMRAIAIVGRDVERGLLEVLVDLSDDDLDAALRAALDVRILTVDQATERVRFRHALLREAILDDLLPTERRRLHRRAAEALVAGGPRTGRPPVAEIAHHWAVAGVPDAALAAYLGAARAAEAAGAWAEAAAALDRALALWDAVDPAARADQDRVDLLRRAGWAYELSGEPRHALGLLLEAVSLAEVDPDGDRLALLCLEAAYVGTDITDARAFPLADRALELTVGRRDRVRARILAYLASGDAVLGNHRVAIEHAEAALALAQEVGEPDALVAAGSALDMAFHNLGRPAEGDAAYLAALEAARSASQPDSLMLVMINHLTSAVVSARLEDGLALVKEAIADSRRLGVDAYAVVWFEAFGAELAWSLGDWETCQATLDRIGKRQPDGQPAEVYWRTRARLAAWRGHHDDARAAIEACRTFAGQGPFAAWSDAYSAVVASEDAAWRSDAGAVQASADAGLAALVPTDELAIRSCLLAVAARGAADRAVATRARGGLDRLDDTGYRGLIAAIRDGRLVPDARPPATAVLFLDLADAELTRLDGRSDPSAWTTAHDGLERLGYRPYAAYARFRLGEALLDEGDRAGATDALAATRAVAEPLGARPLVGLIDDLGRRGRLDLGAAAGSVVDPGPDEAAGSDGRDESVDPWGLSEREREVLALVAEGWTNRRIGEALFISPKTASVHVTHILDKLGVSSRTEAALLAGRAGLPGPAPDEAAG